MKTHQAALAGVPYNDLIKLLAPLPRFRSLQIFKWIARGAQNFNDMSDLPLNLREQLNKDFIIRSCKTRTLVKDRDGTVKFGITLEDGTTIEAVLLSDGKNRKTACISSQAGCPAGCVFCKTGSLGFIRNLSSSEIVEQILLLKESAGTISNIVIMGMGEPLLNLENLRQALSVICDRQGMNMSKRRITVSTCGISEGIIDLADNGPAIRLALSLTAADEGLRKRLMPITLTQSLDKLKKALVYFQNKGGGRITLEVVLLGGINTGQKDAAALAAFSAGLDVVVNIIPWNAFECPPVFLPALREPERTETEDFKKHLETMGIKATCRYRKGRNISAACGLLASNACR